MQDFGKKEDAGQVGQIQDCIDQEPQAVEDINTDSR